MLRIASAMCLVLCLAAPRVGAQTNPAVVGQWETVAPLPFYSTALHLLPTGMVMYYSNGVAYPGGIDAAIGGTSGTYQEMHLIDKQDDISAALRLFQYFQ